ncbi:hypothetical protein OUZ56_021576 [Daphnia magna]|uniref:Uncharacterized protein n=1 Tax=Daphnia magna TaxID=35525 RepID=A0ABR0ATW2_9CRUS|nr:hypothetical protein OUZ56_021576 [Daphnia magna]
MFSNLVLDIVFDRLRFGYAAASLVGLVGVGELLVVVGLQHFPREGRRGDGHIGQGWRAACAHLCRYRWHMCRVSGCDAVDQCSIPVI